MKMGRIGWLSMLLAGGTVLGENMERGEAWERLYPWEEVFHGLILPASVVMEEAEDGAGANPVLHITGSGGKASTVPLLAIDEPGVSAEVYAVEGRIRHSGVEGVGYLEMWNEFPDGSRYFSRTLGDAGSMAKVTGDSGWRDFALPFNRSGTDLLPKRLEINLILPGAGEVFLGPLTLKSYDNPPGTAGDPMISPDVWSLISVASGFGIVLVFVIRFLRKRADTTEARKMKSMDV